MIFLSSNPAMPSFITILIIITISTILIISKWRGKKEAPLPPGPRGLPVIGYLPFLSKNLHHNFTNLADKYGPIFKLWLGNKLCVVVNSSTLAKQLVRDHDKIMANRDVSIAAKVGTYGFSDIAMTPYGSYWRNIRKLFVRDMMNNKNLEASSILRKSEIEKSIKYVYHNIGSKIDIGELGFKTEFHVVISMLWGGTLDEEVREKIASEFRMITGDYTRVFGKPNVSDYFPILARFDFQGVEKEMKSIIGRIDKVFDLVIEERMKTFDDDEIVDGKKDFLHILLELRKHNDLQLAIDNTQIKAILLDIVVGGTDTTSNIFEWVIAELLAHPEAMEKLKQELDEVVGININVEELHLSRLTYLDATIKEAMRLHPPLPFLLPKCPTETSLVGGYMIPKETTVFLNVWAIQRDPSYWDNPSDFIPERFLNNGNSSKKDFDGNDFNFLPFGSGRRICPGVPLAEKMLKYLVAAMLHSFEWRMPEGEKIDLLDKFSLVVKKNKPLLAIPSLK